MTSLRLLFVVFSISLSACSSKLVEPSNAEARARWKSSDIGSYQFDYKLNCFCFGPAARGVTVTVSNGHVVDVRVHDSDATLEDIRSIDTMGALFDQIDKFDADQVHSILAKYDPTLGFPVEFFVDTDAMISDEEWGFTVSHFSIIDP